MTRILAGIAMAIVVILGIIYLPASLLKLFIAMIVALATHEFARMTFPQHPSSSIGLAVILATGFSCLVMFKMGDVSSLTLTFPFVVVTFVFYLFKKHSLELVLLQISLTLMAVFYVGLLLSSLGLIRDLPSGSAWLFMVLATTFGADTGAYIAGHLFGKIKLAPHVSPAKTVEGLLGGLIVSVIVAFLCKLLIYDGFSSMDCIWVGVMVGLMGPVGDLSESMIKRSVGVKDSGKLIPGHGGILDRVDALLFTAPAVYCYALYFKT